MRSTAVTCVGRMRFGAAGSSRASTNGAARVSVATGVGRRRLRAGGAGEGAALMAQQGWPGPEKVDERVWSQGLCSRVWVGGVLCCSGKKLQLDLVCLPLGRAPAGAGRRRLSWVVRMHEPASQGAGPAAVGCSPTTPGRQPSSGWRPRSSPPAHAPRAWRSAAPSPRTHRTSSVENPRWFLGPRCPCPACGCAAHAHAPDSRWAPWQPGRVWS